MPLPFVCGFVTSLLAVEKVSILNKRNFMLNPVYIYLAMELRQYSHLFTRNCWQLPSNQHFYRQIVGYGRGVVHHRVSRW